jgi:hypothetical protein
MEYGECRTLDAGVMEAVLTPEAVGFLAELVHFFEADVKEVSNLGGQR